MSLISLFAVKPTGTMEVPEDDDSQMDEIPQELPNIGMHIEI